MAVYNPSQTSPGYRFQEVPDLSKYDVRERLSQSAMDGFFEIIKKWNLTIEQGGELLGGLRKSTMHNLKLASGTRTQDELTRISYVVGIYKALHILLPDALADEWMTRPNDNRLFAGHTPLSYALRMGIPGLQEIRRLLDASRGGQ
jgi:hypothetical protein